MTAVAERVATNGHTNGRARATRAATTVTTTLDIPELVTALSDLAVKLARAELRAETAEANINAFEARATTAETLLVQADQERSILARQLAEAEPTEAQVELQRQVDAMKHDLLEINANLNHYGGNHGWCSSYEGLLYSMNARMQSEFRFAGRAYEDRVTPRNGSIGILQLPERWRPIDWS